MSQKQEKNLLLRVFLCYAPVLKKYRILSGLIFIFYGFGSLFTNVLVPLVYSRIIDTISSNNSRVGVAQDLFGNFWLLVICIVIYQLFFRAGDYTMVYAQSKMMKDVSDQAYSGIERQSYRFFSAMFTGSLVAKTKRYVRSFESLIDYMVFSIWMTFVNIVGVLVALVIVSPTLGGMFFIWILVYLYIAFWFARKKSVYDLAVSQQDSAVIARLSDIVSNISVVKIFGATERERKSFEDVTDKEEILRRKAWNYQNLIFVIQISLLSLLEIFGMYIAIKLWLSGEISSGTVALVQIYIASIFSVLFSVGRIFAKIAGSLADADEMTTILNHEPDVADPEFPEEDRISEARIEFQNVSFRYEGGDGVFEDLSFSVKEGEKVGLVGPSGAGKTTVTKLLLRYMDPQQGRITIGGQNIRTIRQEDLRRHIAYVPQEPLLFHRSIRENISYARPDSNPEEVTSAAKKAEAHQFISLLPDGYETLVGERGVKLSGGERQRVAIARAILKDAPILVLDEATSALDSENEALIQVALEDLMEGKTVLVIAHRLSTIRKMDRIIVFDSKGKIVEQGTHDNLLVQSGLYASLWNRQTGAFITEDE